MDHIIFFVDINPIICGDVFNAFLSLANLNFWHGLIAVAFYSAHRCAVKVT